MQRPLEFSPEIPWVLVAQVDREFEVSCIVCGAFAYLYDEHGVGEFAGLHRAHTAGEGHLGLGDVVAAIAKPIASVFGSEPCTPCEARRRALNAARMRWPF